MAREFKYLPRVAQWLPVVEELNDTPLPTWAILALIHVESNGRAKAIGRTRKYWGLLQIGPKAAYDIAPSIEPMYYYGKGRASITGLLTLCKRYEAIHQWEPEWVALMWKAGVGTLEKYIKKLVANTPKDELQKWLKSKWDADLYLKWFNEAAEVWQKDMCYVDDDE